jgi:CRP-like cAMP-binding protein
MDDTIDEPGVFAMTAILSELRRMARGNRLLATLPGEEYERLLPELEIVEARVRDMLYEAGRPIRHVWFPISGVISMIAALQDGDSVEVGTIGNEGMVGLPVFLGAEAAPMTTFAQVPGTLVRMRADGLRQEVERGGPLTQLLHRYTQAFFTQLSQSVACNRLHNLPERLARWMLMTQDRADDVFPMTHEFMGLMLGVHRPAVTEALQELRRAGALAYERGEMRIVDRAALEEASCECYRIIRGEYDRMIGSP